MTSDRATLRGAKTQTSSGDPVRVALRWVHPEIRDELFWLDRPGVRIGRGEENDVALPGDEISRVHAEIRQQGLVLVIADLDSTNGLFVNGVRTKEAVLTPNGVVRMGEWVAVVTTGRDEEIIGPFGEIAPGYLGGPRLRAALEPLRMVAPTELPVILEGETGTGKEGAATTTHAWSKRTGPFVAVNCAALPEGMAEGELFGYRRGAFTGAERNHPGFFRAAHGGTLFLDEIVELPPALQPKLLRALEQREVIPLGQTQPERVDVRVVCAAQIPLVEAVAEKRFRADLFGRLDGLTVKLPPLRARIEDVPYLFQQLLRRHAAAGAATPVPEARLIEQLCLFDWPLNVRELDLLTRRLLATTAGSKTLKRSDLPERMRAGPRPRPLPGAASAAAPEAPRAEVTLEDLMAALRAHKGNVARAAAALGISRQKAYRMVETDPEVDLAALRDAPPGKT